MASQPTQDGHLAASSDREVVYCHACSNEWYRDEGGLICPSCHSDVTEIVSLDNDPRDFGTQDSDSPSPPFQYNDEEGSDPEEADIDDHMGQHGFVHHTSTRTGNDPHHHSPAVDPVMERFLDMINGFGGQEARGQQTQTESRFGPPRVHHATFTSGTFRGGTASVTIFSGPAGQRPRDDAEGGGGGGGATSTDGADSFQSIFDGILRGIGPPPAGDQQRENPGLARGLHDILSLFAPANAVAGDAVYTQEALDRIITNLMESQPQSNAAPPASAEGLAKLERKTVDEELLKLNEGTECSICIDEVALGDTAAFLPCKHWFHEDCVVMWLQEHNTCPVCRTPIEKREANETGRASAGNSAGVGPSGSLPGQTGSRPTLLNFGLFSPGMPRFTETNRDPNQRAAPTAYSTSYAPPPPREASNTTDDAVGGGASSSSFSFRERERERSRATSSNFTYDTSRLQRRSSHSPSSPRAAGPGESTARHRQRSPSESNRRPSTDHDSENQSSGGPLSWFRGRFSGGSAGRGPSQDGQ